MKTISVYNERLEILELSVLEKLLVESFLKLIKQNYNYSKEIFHFKDGKMGSFGFVYDDVYQGKGKYIGEIAFYDEDKTPCYANMFLYENGWIDSIDIWRVDFESIRKLPQNESEYFIDEN